jgi:hypothetical protein
VSQQRYPLFISGVDSVPRSTHVAHVPRG